MNENPEYNLEDPVNNVLLEKEINKRKKMSIIFASIVMFLSIIIIGIILYFTIFKKDKESGKDPNTGSETTPTDNPDSGKESDKDNNE